MVRPPLPVLRQSLFQVQLGLHVCSSPTALLKVVLTASFPEVPGDNYMQWIMSPLLSILPSYEHPRCAQA